MESPDGNVASSITRTVARPTQQVLSHDGNSFAGPSSVPSGSSVQLSGDLDDTIPVVTNALGRDARGELNAPK